MFFCLVYLAESGSGVIDEFGKTMNKAVADTFNKENFDLFTQKASEAINAARDYVNTDEVSI